MARQTCAPDAYGEVVWFGRRGAGAKSGRGESFSRATEAKEPFSGESTKQAVKPLRREGRDAPPVPVCSCECFVCANRTRDRGCSVRPVFPAPSSLREGNTKMQTSGKHVARTRNYIRVIASAAKQSTSPLAARWIAFAALAMTRIGRGVSDPPVRALQPLLVLTIPDTMRPLQKRFKVANNRLFQKCVHSNCKWPGNSVRFFWSRVRHGARMT